MTYYCCFILFLHVCICSHLYNYCLKARQQVWDMSLSYFLVIVLINDVQHSLPVINPSLSQLCCPLCQLSWIKSQKLTRKTTGNPEF